MVGKLTLVGIVILIVAIAAYIGLFSNSGRQSPDIALPKNGETKTEKIIIENGEVVDVLGESIPKNGETKTEKIIIENGEVVDVLGESIGASPKVAILDKITETMEVKEIMVTDGVRHSVPLVEINTLLSADGIPSIDNPKFVSIPEANKFLKDSEPGVAFARGDTQKFYPYQILTWHEIVNDIVEGERVLIAYCPLCLTGYALDPLVKGERVEFGTSGKLWKSNLVMYDRKTNSLWSQVLAESILGEMTGTRLKVLPSDQMRYGEWKKANPKGEVLSRDTGFSKRYGTYPYAGGNYFGVDDLSLKLANPSDTRLPNDAFVLGIVINNKAKAYDIEAVKKIGELQDEFQGEIFLLKHDEDLDVVRMFRRLPDSTWDRVNPISGFWFSWAAAHPDTELYK